MDTAKSCKNILLLIDNLSGGGAEAVVVRLAQGFADLGHNVHIIIFQNLIEYDLPQEITLHVLDKAKRSEMSKQRYYGKAADELTHYLRNLNVNFDLVIANLPQTHRVAMRTELPKTVYCIHNSYFTIYVKPKGWIGRTFQIVKFRRRFGNRDLAFVSQGAQHELMDIVGVKPRSYMQIYNPFPVKELQAKANEPLDFKQPFFLHVGRFAPAKRHDLLLESFHKSGVQDHLVLIGQGPADFTDKIKKKISELQLDERVHLVGFQENPQKYMKNAKALLLCSKYEGFGNVIVESLICGTPVISLNCPSGPAEILSGPLKEYLIPMDDKDGFARKIAEVSASPRRIDEETGQIARFSHVNVAEQYLSFCES